MKVLLLSHNPVTTYNNMGKTFLSLFSAFRPEELCQLYLYPARTGYGLLRQLLSLHGSRSAAFHLGPAGRRRGDQPRFGVP